MNKVRQLQNPQSELFLLRNYCGVSKLYFTLRSTCPTALQYATSLFDDNLMQYLRQIMVGDGAGFGLVQQRLATLPMKDGGLGVYIMADTGKYCFLASCAQTQHFQNRILNLPSVSEPSPRYEHALRFFTQACSLSVSSFNINDAAPFHMKNMAVLYFGVVKEAIPTNFAFTDRESHLWQCNRNEHAMDFFKSYFYK